MENITMDLSQYNNSVSEIKPLISDLAETLANRIKRLISENSDDIKSLKITPGFVFLDSDGDPMEIEDDLYIKVFSYGRTPIYYSAFSAQFVTLEYQPDLGTNFSNDITNQLVDIISSKPSTYKSMLHLVALDGILEQDFQLKSQILNELKKL